MQSKSLYSVRTAFKLMQTDLDPLLQGVLTSFPACNGSCTHTCQVTTACCCYLDVASTSCCAACKASAGPLLYSTNDRSGTLQSAQPAEPPVRETAEAQAMISRDQMRAADRIIVNVLQKVCHVPQWIALRGPARNSFVHVESTLCCSAKSVCHIIQAGDIQVSPAADCSRNGTSPSTD